MHIHTYLIDRQYLSMLYLISVDALSFTSWLEEPWRCHGRPEITCHDDVLKWKHFPHYWPFARWRYQKETFSTLLAICAGNSPVPGHKGQWRGALMFSLFCVWINGWVNNGEAGDLRRYLAHYDVTVVVRGIHRSPVNSPHKGQWRGALMFSLICAWINGWVNNREAGDWRRHRPIMMSL